MHRRFLVFVFLLVLAGAHAAAAKEKALVIVDMTTGSASNTPTLGRRWYVFHEPEPAAAITALTQLQASEVQAAKASLEQVESASDPRVLLATGDTFHLAVLYTSDQSTPEVKITEDRRKTRFAEDLATLVKIARAIRTTRTAAPRTYLLLEMIGGTNGLYPHSTIKIAITTKPVAEGLDDDLSKTITSVQTTATDNGVTTRTTETTTKVTRIVENDAAAAAKQTAAESPEVSVDVALINGPVEHLFISADVPVSRVSEVKYDATGKAIGTKETPKVFYAGLNFMRGDVIAVRRDSWTDGLMLKGMARISKRPLDSYGLGAGYRFPSALRAFGYDLNGFSVFAAYLRTRTGSADTKKYSNQWRYGLSFNLDSALDWVKSASK